jgi:hypothetical protein
MLLNVGEVVQAIGALNDDPANQVIDKDYCLPFINLAWMDIAAEFNALGLQYQEEVVVLSAVPAGTSDLSTFQAAGELLESIVLPTLVEWKRTEEEDTQYREVALREKLPDVQTEDQGISAYQWRKGKVIVTPSSIAVDIRVTFKAYSLDFVDPVTSIIVGAGNLIAYKASEMLNSPKVRNDAAAVAYFAAKFRDAADNFEVLCVKQKNREGFRIGRMHGRRRVQPIRIVATSGLESTMGTRHSPIDQPNGVLTSFRFYLLPSSPTNYQLYVNGVLTTSGYTQVSDVITFLAPLAADTELYAYY